MLYTRKTATYAIGLLLILLSFISCNEEEQEEKPLFLIGAWEVDTFDYVISINGLPLSTFFDDESQAQLIEAFISTQVNEQISGNQIEFMADQTYLWDQGNNQQQTGTWMYEAESSTLTLDEGTEEEQSTVIDPLNEESFGLSLTELLQFDVNFDGVEEQLRIAATLQMKKIL